MSLGARKLGLMGGSFDPVHQAHVALATTALQHLALEAVHWVPVGQPWQKTRQLAPAEHRLAMVRAATQHEPRFVVDDIELRRSGPSYTLDTVQALQVQHPQAQWRLIIGQDQYANLHTWHGWQDLLARVTLAVACRGDQRPQPSATLAAHPHRVEVLPMPPMNLSSTDIRARLARGERAQTLAPAMVSETVAGYIDNHHLYAPGHTHLHGHP
ncbi:nicotinate-nucleotide adenylyltransferase [Aquabacterium lacunae]|nr:nicotinate-nucleotide adenylyltransferase [Aquabacterium lacunae]